MIGRTLGHYEIVEELGAGGMGVVYRARDARLRRSVAFKVLSEDFTGDPERRARFLQEARSASAVNHPAIAQIYDADEADGVAFIAMELVEGRTVRQLVQDRELDVLGAVEIGIQVAEGLAKAHDANIVHRDIKSDNIMVTPDGHAKILDFGLAKPFATGSDDGADTEATVMNTLATHPGMVVGTLAYMSPEQARGRNVDPRSDLFSLGIVLYEMVTGQLPFRGDSPLDTLHAIAFEETQPVTALRSNLPPSLHRAVSRCLRKRPQDRYESAGALARDLRAVVREIDSGITRSVPLADKIRDGMAALRSGSLPPWAIPVAAVAAAAVIVVAIWRADSLPSLIPIGLLGLVVYRRVKNKRQRLVRKFAKQAAKLEEVQLVSARDTQITVVVERPLAKTYVRLNSLLDRTNGKLFFGEHFTLTVREDAEDDEIRKLLESTGVAFVRDDLSLPERGGAG